MIRRGFLRSVFGGVLAALGMTAGPKSGKGLSVNYQGAEVAGRVVRVRVSGSATGVSHAYVVAFG